jgi:DNA-binding Lrp family transcriptional regulator
MPFSTEDKHVIKMLRQTKQYGAKRLISMFPNKQWSLGGLQKLIRKIDDTGKVDRRSAPGSGRPRTARLADKVNEVDDLVLSQENAPKTHRTQRQISRETGISLTSVNRIIRKDLRLKCLKKRRAHELTEANKNARCDRCRQLLKRYPASMVNFIWFTDEKMFTVAAPSNSQNDRLYAPVAVRKKDVAPDRLLRTRPTFTKSIMVSVGVSALGRTSLHFVDPGVKVNGQ